MAQPIPTFLGISGGNETILVVEDEETVRNIAVKTLKKFGYNVLSATDGAEGIDIFSRERDNIDLILLDLTMPRISGEMVLDNIIQQDPRAKVIICSGMNDQSNDACASARGYISKPYQLADLASKIRETLDS